MGLIVGHLIKVIESRQYNFSTMVGPCFMLITIISLYVFSYEGSCSGNQENAETKAPARENNIEEFKVYLIRRDSPISPFLDIQNLSNVERLRQSIQWSDNRLGIIVQYLKSGTNFNPISVQYGEFFMQIMDRSTLNLIVNTGSDLIWTKCRPLSSKYNHAYSLHYTNTSFSALGVHRCDNDAITPYCINTWESFGYKGTI